VSRIDDLFDTYDQCPHAVAFVELIVCGNSPRGANGWDVLMEAALEPDEVVEAICDVSAGETVGKMQVARAEMRLPQFRQYIAGKMGLM
jgi:hypothetical protein